MNKVNKISLTIVLCLIAMFRVDGSMGQHGADSMVAKFEHYARTLMLEKLFVHLDQQFYLVGETMWFSIYCTDGTLHRPLDVSKVVYLEVLSGAKAVLQTKIAMTGGRGNGSLYLPATLESGNYTVRAYTNWMKNFDPALYFHDEISVVNPFVKPLFSATPAGSHRVEFFPEGGHLVAGLPARVAFKVSDNNGSGIVFTGAILDDSGDTLSIFTPDKFGIGSFQFTPQAKTYRVVIRDSANRISQHSLPSIRQEGYAMQVKDSVDRWLKITVRSSFQSDSGPMLLFAHARRVIFLRESRHFSSNMTSFSIEKSSLPDGISHFTVFNSTGVPICERLYFKYPERHLEIAVQTQSEYGTRKKITLELQTTLGNTPVTADVSVAVFKEDPFAPPAAQRIHQYLWLESELTGAVESIDYYFNAPRAEAAKAMDNLMLTHGWRKFKWDGLAHPPALKFLPEYRHHIVEASINGSSGPVSGMLNYLSVPGNAAGLYATRSDARGMMRFEVDQLGGKNKLVLQSASPAPVQLKIFDPFSAAFRSETTGNLRLSSAHEASLLQRAVAMQAEDIYHEERALAQAPREADTLGFYGVADEEYYLDDYTRFPVMEEVMREYVPGVFVRKRKDGFHFLVVNNHGGVMDDPLILLDGVPVSNADRIMRYDPRKVKKLEVVKRKFFMGSAYFPGIVSYTTYSRDAAGLELDPWSVTIDYDGLQLQREFSMPSYPTQKHVASRIPDRRHLLYWNPSVTTSRDGKAIIEFYTSDVKGRYQVVVQGLSDQGKAGMDSVDFLVK